MSLIVQSHNISYIVWYNCTWSEIMLSRTYWPSNPQVLACSTSDQLLYLAQSLTSKLQVPHLIQRARDLVVQMANSKGLSEQLSALLIQVHVVLMESLKLLLFTLYHLDSFMLTECCPTHEARYIILIICNFTNTSLHSQVKYPLLWWGL